MSAKDTTGRDGMSNYTITLAELARIVELAISYHGARSEIVIYNAAGDALHKPEIGESVGHDALEFE